MGEARRNDTRDPVKNPFAVELRPGLIIGGRARVRILGSGYLPKYPIVAGLSVKEPQEGHYTVNKVSFIKLH